MMISKNSQSWNSTDCNQIRTDGEKLKYICTAYAQQTSKIMFHCLDQYGNDSIAKP